MKVFQIVVSTLPGFVDPATAIAASRAGAVGILDLEYTQDTQVALEAVQKLGRFAKGDYGVKLNSHNSKESLDALLLELPPDLKYVVLTYHEPSILPLTNILREQGRTVYLETSCVEQARHGEQIGVDGVIAKGHEAGGRVGEDTAFILLQQYVHELSTPIWVHGGIGLHTAAACRMAGAAGVMLDVQVALAKESNLPDIIRNRIALTDGSETICLGGLLGERYRMFSRPDCLAVESLHEEEVRLFTGTHSSEETLDQWRSLVYSSVGWHSVKENILPLGQDASFASRLAEQFVTVGGIVDAIRQSSERHCELAGGMVPFDEDSPLAQAHGLRYPVVQGPMTRVSDVPAFAKSVADSGGLPFVALALLKGEDARDLLEETQKLLGEQPWGVGILGFVPIELRQEQLEAILAYRPPFALIAGGRPDQAQTLEEKGIPTYLHVPSPGLLEMFLKQGVRRFVFEGRECGGHVGPRASFILWESMIDVLIDYLKSAADPSELHILFAGGIHDALSASMVAAMAAPLAEQGVRLGTLLGTSYLFTEEAVATGAIAKSFQDEIIKCKQTVLLETGAGHASRCAKTPYVDFFMQEQQRLYREGKSAEEIRYELEELNLGRLRMASKGITRHPDYGKDPDAPRFTAVPEDVQKNQGMYMIGQVAIMRDEVCTIEQLHQDIALGSTQRLKAEWGTSRQPVTLHEETRPSDIAIIGMANLFPKALDLHTYWENIVNKVYAIIEVPKERWNWELYYDPDPKTRDKAYSRWGAFLNDIVFDPTKYGMPPNSLASIEPMQLLALEVANTALEDAGYINRHFPRERTSVFFGAGGGAGDVGLGYGFRALLPHYMERAGRNPSQADDLIEQLDGILPEWTEDSFPGILLNVISGRISNRLDLGGTNFTVDAACASSMAAIALAVRELDTRESDMVIVGGADTMQSPYAFMCFSKTMALSPTGEPRTFDETSDGIVIGEGVAAAVLKRLEDAERDGDRIYAVIKAVGSSSDGRDKGLTAPRPAGQVLALERAYHKAGFSPDTVQLFEAHGTGTAVGDLAEAESLKRVLNEAGAPRQSCAIGSVKTMIGHTKCSAGIAGLIKTAMALHHKTLPPTLGVISPNPKINFPESPLYVNTEARPWIVGNGTPRRAGVSAFGFGGTNFHVVLEEYSDGYIDTREIAISHWPTELFLIRRESRQKIVTAIEEVQNWIHKNPEIELKDLAYTVHRMAQSELTDQDVTLSLVANSVEDLAQKLERTKELLVDPQTTNINDPQGVYFSPEPMAYGSKIAFLFPGQGSQYVNMLKDLTILFPEIRELFEQADDVLMGKLPKPLSSYVFPIPTFTEEDAQAQRRELTQTNVAQPAIGVVDMAMYYLLRSLGVDADMMAGHSYGEFAALCASGCFDFETLLALSEARGRYIVEGAGSEPGTMAAVEGGREQVEDVIRGIDGVVIANLNAPTQTIISGPQKSIEEAVDRFKAQGRRATLLPVACAFHSEIVTPACDQLADFLNQIEIRSPRIPVFSNTTAEMYPETPDAIAERLVEHLVNPVEFVQEIEQMYAAGARIFVEVGPRNVLTGLADKILADLPKLVLTSDQPKRHGLTQLHHLLGQLASHGMPVQLDRFYEGRQVQTLSQVAAIREPSSASWLVNGTRSKPISEVNTPTTKKQPAVKQQPEMKQQDTLTTNQDTTGEQRNQTMISTTHAPSGSEPSATKSQTGMNSQPSAKSQVQPQQIPPTSAHSVPTVASAQGNGSGTAQIIGQFQQVMNRFLDTQRNVMLAYLQANQGSAAVQSQIHQVSQDASLSQREEQTTFIPDTQQIVLEPIRDSATSSETQPSSVETPEAATPTDVPVKEDRIDVEVWTSHLLQVVSERTGYPVEMLGMDLDLEAELGIDSIKRIEILSSFQEVTDISSDELDMEGLASVKTLRGIIEWMQRSAEAVSSTVDSPSPTASSVQPPEGDTAGEMATDSELILGGQIDVEVWTSHLLQVVSERTGYPAEMLGMDLDLEADLGIDSIKRIEILSRFQEVTDISGDELDMEGLASVKTLRGIIEWMQRSAEAQSTVITQTVLATVSSAPTMDNTVPRYILARQESPIHPVPGALAEKGTLLITDDEQGCAVRLAEKLRQQGHQVVLARMGAECQAVAAEQYMVDFNSFESISSLAQALQAEGLRVVGIIHLLPLRETPDYASISLPEWRDALRPSVKGLFYLAKAFGQQLNEMASKGGACFLSVSAMGGDFASTSSDASFFPGQGGIAGLTKTIFHEWPNVRVRAIDFCSQMSSEAIADCLLQEILSDDEQVEVGYDSHSRRLQLRPVETPLGMNENMLEIDHSSVLLVTGGARGITAEVARELAKHYQPTLLLVGRSPLPASEEPEEFASLSTPQEIKARLIAQMRESGQKLVPAEVEKKYIRLCKDREIRENLQALKSAGARIHYFSVDVCDEDAFGQFIDEIYETYGTIDGVIHGAGIIEDKLIRDKTPDSFDRVFDTKVESAFILSRKLRSDSLKFLVFFSSVAGRFGNRGQGDYAAANEIYGKLALWLDKRWSARVVSIIWGPWEASGSTDGMVSPELQKQFAQYGIQLVPRSVGPHKMIEELRFGSKGDVEVILGGGGWETALRRRRSTPSPDMDLSVRTARGRRLGEPVLLTNGKTRITHRSSEYIEIIRELDTTYDRYLRDHVLDGTPVMPMAMALELSAQAAILGWPDRDLTGVRNMRLLQGITVRNGAQPICIGAQSQSNRLLSVKISDPGEEDRVHYQAEIEWENHASRSYAPLKIVQSQPLPMTIKDAYRQWLFHGPLFQGIREVEAIGTNGVIAVLATSSPEGYIDSPVQGSWLIDPLIVDSGLQLLILWARTYRDMTPLPSQFARYNRISPIQEQQVRCEVHIRPETSKYLIHADIAFLNQQGQLLGLLEDMQVTCSRALNRLSEK